MNKPAGIPMIRESGKEIILLKSFLSKRNNPKLTHKEKTEYIATGIR
jgi:hypothetical protein